MGIWIQMGRTERTVRSRLTRRWIINVFLPIFAVLIAVDIALIVIIHNTVYDNLTSSLYSRAEVTAEFASGYISKNSETFYSNIKTLCEDFSDKDRMEFQVLSPDGLMLYSSSGFVSPFPRTPVDFIASLSEESGFWLGNDDLTGEKVMAVSRTLTDESASPIIVLRFICSVYNADTQIFQLALLSVSVIALILLIIVVIGTYFVRSIIRPVTDISDAAKQIAQGKLDVRIDKQYNDEIGELSATINNMAKALAETDRLENEFISIISHELRTPITAIQGWIETMSDPEMQNEAVIQKGYSIIKNETVRLKHMVEELLDFSHLQSGKLAMTFGKVEVLSEFEETVFLCMQKARAEKIRLQYADADDIPAIWGDRDRIKQVFVNILDNAIKHTPAGGTIHASISADDKFVTAIISDTGAGISAQDLPNIKKKFYKGHTTKRGTGLGLAVCDEVIKRHGGELRIESEQGKGTTVSIILPIERPENLEHTTQIPIIRP